MRTIFLWGSYRSWFYLVMLPGNLLLLLWHHFFFLGASNIFFFLFRLQLFNSDIVRMVFLYLSCLGFVVLLKSVASLSSFGKFSIINFKYNFFPFSRLFLEMKFISLSSSLISNSLFNISHSVVFSATFSTFLCFWLVVLLLKMPPQA